MQNKVVIAVDIDPSGPGTYPVDRIEPPPPAAETWDNAIESVNVIRCEWEGRAVVTVHTSPLFRWDFLSSDYLQLYRRVLSMGGAIGIHPHEDRNNGGNFYDNQEHMRHVIKGVHKTLTQAGIHPQAFRSSFFAFADCLPQLLSQLDIQISLSSAPALRASEEGAEWSPQWGDDFTNARPICRKNYLHGRCQHETWDVYEIPLGWSGETTQLKADHLFNEGSSLENLCSVWRKVRERARSSGEAQTVCFLCHGFGLGDDQWREQALKFIDFVLKSGDKVAAPEELISDIVQ